MAFIKRRKYGSNEIYYACFCSERSNENTGTKYENALVSLGDKTVVRKTLLCFMQRQRKKPMLRDFVLSWNAVNGDGVAFSLFRFPRFWPLWFHVAAIIWKILSFCIQIFRHAEKILTLFATESRCIWSWWCIRHFYAHTHTHHFFACQKLFQQKKN